MKRRTLLSDLFALALVAGIFPFTLAAPAQSRSSQLIQRNDQTPEESGTFVGQIVVAHNGTYALLTDPQAGAGYYLDDQSKARQFEGEHVKVVGTLDIPNFTIHVSDIQPAA